MDTSETGRSGQPLDISWAGKGSDYIGLGFKVFFLKIITLGIYHFWGKTEVRKRLWNHVRVNSEPLEYTGTGMELFLGFLIVMLVVFLPLFLGITALQLLFIPHNMIAFGVGVTAIYVFLLFLIGVAIYNAHRYRLSRTQWRGIRGALKGSAWGYAWTAFWTSIVTGLTLFLAYPWQSIKLQRKITDNTYFGETPMRFTGSSKPLFKIYIIPWLAFLGGLVVLGFLLTPYFQLLQSHAETGIPMDPYKQLQINLAILGYYFAFLIVMSVIYAWYQSKYYNYIAEHTHFSNGNFSLNTTPGGLIWLTLSNLLIVIVSLTILSPVAIARMFGYFVSNMSFNGGVDINAIEQSAESLSKTGEGLAEGFDVSSF